MMIKGNFIISSIFFKWLFFLVFVLGTFWSFGFAGFLQEIQNIDQTSSKVDGIVVLTGGPGRIDAGLKALAKGQGKRLLISGVNQSLANEIILDALGSNHELVDCCVDLGREATDTKENAKEAIQWAENNNYSSLLIITADFHMPRGLLAFNSSPEDLKLVPYPVKTHISPLMRAFEFNKYLLSLVRASFSL